MSRPAGRANVLLAITVYDGRSFVPAALRSAVRIGTQQHDLDVLVLDDHSPETGWSEELAALCRQLGVRYYCSPRNLGIPRNVNLGLLAARSEGYSHVIIANSDVLFPTNLLDSLIGVCDTDERIASVTAWSNNASMYSLPNDEPARFLADQARVDWVSNTLRQHYGATAIDVPAGISFCMLMPTWAVSTVGLMDPVFGRGYCEETDWSRRSLSLGYRCVLAPGVFTYHAGRGSNETAGLLRPGATSVEEHEAIIDMRYPDFRDAVARYEATGVLGALHSEASRVLVQAATRQHGFVVEIGHFDASPSGADGSTPALLVGPGPEDVPVTARYLGFHAVVDTASHLDERQVVEAMKAFAGGAPVRRVDVLDDGPRTQRLLEALDAAPNNSPRYPSRV
jgi:GT2 family glycosyltransferase